MGRILGIDYGKSRVGLAATDPLQIIVTGLPTIETQKLQDYLLKYCSTENVDLIVIGLPTHKDGNFTYLKKDIDDLVSWLGLKLPQIKYDFQDESFSSVQAKEIIFQSGYKQKDRRDKKLVDKISAVLILQKYLKHI